MKNKLKDYELTILTAMIHHLEARTTFQNIIDDTFFTDIEMRDVYRLILSKQGLPPEQLIMELTHSKIMNIDDMDKFIKYVDSNDMEVDNTHVLNEIIRYKRLRDINNAYQKIDQLDPADEDIDKLGSVIKTKETNNLIYGNVNDCFSSISTQFREKIEGKTTVIPTGLDFLDKLLGGGAIKGSTIISGRGGAGKTSLVLQAVAKFGETHKDKINFFFSGEVAYENIAQKVVSHTAKINIRNIQNMKLDKDESKRFLTEGNIERENVFFIEVNAFCVNDALVIINKLSEATNKEVGLVCFDYLQLMKPNDKSIKDKLAIVDEISANIRECGKLYRTFAISNMKKEVANSGEPSVNDLKGSSNIEYDATAIIMLWKEKEDNNKEIIAKTVKNRFGIAPLYEMLNFEGSTGTFEPRVGYNTDEPYKPTNNISDVEWDGF